MSKYELVAGLETHVELATKTKIFCGCTTEFGGEPNTHCCPVCIGLPGTLPKLNQQVVDYAIMAGLATNCQISLISKMDRKNYVYPDLPKAYQISQFDQPLCHDGHIKLSDGRTIRILRIHIEEDAGKLVHSRGNTFIDYNRGGVPLIEIVTEPDFRSIDEVREYVEKIQFIMRYIGVSDCKMQEGSMRCDVNVSIRPVGSDELGTRTEIKNMNSINFITKAIEYEYARQTDVLESGKTVIQETRRYDEGNDCTESMRSKEDAQDYRYFRDPDLVTIHTTEDKIKELSSKLPEPSEQKLQRYINEYGLNENDAQMIIRYRKIYLYYDEVCKEVVNKKAVATCILGQIFRRLDSDSAKEAFNINVSAENLAKLIKYLDNGKIRMNLVKSTLDKMLDTGKAPDEFISESDLAGISDDDLSKLCNEAINKNPNAVKDFLNGKEKAIKAMVGYIMKSTRGRADAQKSETMLIEIIKQK